MMPLMNDNALSQEEQTIKYIGTCTYDHFLNWLADAKDFIMMINEDIMYQLETMVIDQVLADKGLPNDIEYFQANPDRPWFKHVAEGDMEYLLGLIRSWREGSDEPLDMGRWAGDIPSAL